MWMTYAPLPASQPLRARLYTCNSGIYIGGIIYNQWNGIHTSKLWSNQYSRCRFRNTVKTKISIPPTPFILQLNYVQSNPYNPGVWTSSWLWLPLFKGWRMWILWQWNWARINIKHYFEHFLGEHKAITQLIVYPSEESLAHLALSIPANCYFLFKIQRRTYF